MDPLLDLLKERDPLCYNQIDRANPRRVLRALEVTLGTKTPFSSYRHQLSSRLKEVNIIPIGLYRDRNELYNRIDKRVELMLEEGLLEEVVKLKKFERLPSLKTIGYQELFPYFRGEYDLKEAIRLIKRNSRRYAKRQMTFFRRDASIKWFSPLEVGSILAYLRANLVGMPPK